MKRDMLRLACSVHLDEQRKVAHYSEVLQLQNTALIVALCSVIVETNSEAGECELRSKDSSWTKM